MSAWAGVSWQRERCRCIVIVQQVFGQHPSQVMLVDDQHPVQELPPQGASNPLADRVRSGRLRRADQDPDALRGEHASKELVNWPARSLIRNLTEVARWPRSIGKLRAACVVHAPSGLAVTPARWTRRVLCSMTISA